MSKICSICHQELDESQFYFKDKKTNKLCSECKSCHNNRVKEKYYFLKNYIEELKSKSGCAKCGETKGYLLDYHHINPLIKDDTINEFVSKQKNQEDILTEISKCVVLCSNCHREFHYFERHYKTKLEDYLNPKYYSEKKGN